MTAEVSSIKRKNIEMVIKMIKNKVLKAQPNNEQSLIMMATNEDRIISYEEKSQMSSRVNTLKSLQFNHLDTAHFV